MHLTFVAFNFKGSDAASEEQHYADYHVALAKSLPGVCMYLTGRLRPVSGARLDHLRAAILGFKTAEGSSAAMASAAGAKIIADTQAHLSDLRLEAFEAEAVVPFEAAPPGTRRFVLAAAFDFRPEQGALAAAERNYKARHVEIARKLPGLKGYLIARLGGPGAGAPDRQRIAMLMFESFDEFRSAFRSPIGKELTGDGEATITNLRFDHIDARVEV